MDKVIVTLFGLAAIVFVYWFFLRKPERPVAVSDVVKILVEGGYRPDVIEVHQGHPVTLQFLRTDPSSCLEEVVLGDFQIRTFLPVNETVPVTITPARQGTFVYSCGMNMFHGKILVKE